MTCDFCKKEIKEPIQERLNQVDGVLNYCVECYKDRLVGRGRMTKKEVDKIKLAEKLGIKT